MQLRDIMTVGVVTIGVREPVSAARAEKHRHRIRHLVAVDGIRVAGILSERGLGGLTADEAPSDRTVQDLMTSIGDSWQRPACDQPADVSSGEHIWP
jgi:CBS domain-containing protein